MKTTTRVWQHVFGMVCLVASSAVQAQPARGQSPAAQRSSDRQAQRCLGRAPERTIFPQGTLLWGTQRQREQDESSSVLVSVALDSLRRDGERVSEPKLSGGRLVSGTSRGTAGSEIAAGTELRAMTSDGRSVDVVLCKTEPSPGDPELVWYSVEYWNEQTESWENPCAGTVEVPQPRALLVPGVWGADGARSDPPGGATLACETGVIAKCIQWGYKPWATKNGDTLAGHHQACTRMARADYCGNGRSHTRTGTGIDLYDSAGVQQRTTERTAGWDPARAVFEAAWTPEGAYCLTRVRDGRAIEEILGECPGRFEAKADEDLGNGDRCAFRRAGAVATSVLLRNRAISAAQEGATPPAPPAAQEGATPPAPPAAQEGATLVEKRAALKGKNEQPREVSLSVVTLTDGQTLRGQIVSETQDSVTLELVSGGRMELDRSSIRSITENKTTVQVTSTGDLWFRDPNRTRYFYAPSAMMLKRGEGYFSQKELFFSAIAYGITDNVSVLLGAVVPAWLIPMGSGTSGINLIGAVKAGFSLSDNFHVAAGTEALTLPMIMNGGIAVGFVFASATYGNTNAHITLSGGKPFLLSWGSSILPNMIGDALFVLAGEVRVGPNLALMTENWIMPFFFTGQPDVLTVHAVGGRFFGDRWAFDLGFIFLPRVGGMPMPWVDFTYNFGG